MDLQLKSHDLSVKHHLLEYIVVSDHQNISTVPISDKMIRPMIRATVRVTDFSNSFFLGLSYCSQTSAALFAAMAINSSIHTLMSDATASF